MIISKVDLTKEDPNYYKVGLKPELRDLDPYYYLSIQGKSSPEDPKFLTAIESIYAIAYGIKFLCKGEDNDFVVPKMEGFWWVDGGAEAQAEFIKVPRDEWNWQITIRMPDFVEADHFFRALEGAKQKHPENDKLNQIKFELINEGRSAQILHVGSYENEEESLKKLHGFIAEQGLQIAGKHHEIYLSDPRKTAEDKLRTILRYSVA